MKRIIPANHTSLDYQSALESFVRAIHHKQKENLKSVFLTGSYARGDASDASDLDVWCIFGEINVDVLSDVGRSARQLPIAYDQLEVNAQCLSVKELKSKQFYSWAENPIKALEGVLLYGQDFFEDVSIVEVELLYKKYLTDILMSIRHYISVDEPVEKLSVAKLKMYILKPLMFPLRLERYCSCGFYPLTVNDLFLSYDNGLSKVIGFFIDPERLEAEIRSNHRGLLRELHDLVMQLI